MEIKLVSVGLEDKETLNNLYQFYEYDFSTFTNRDLSENGRYKVNIDYFWEGDDRWKPYFIEKSGTIVGFLVVLLENMDIDPDPTHVIYDFMILQKFRRAGIGCMAAIAAFELYEANWAVAEMENNVTAISFWRNVIRRFIGENHSEIYRPELKKYFQRFSTKKK